MKEKIIIAGAGRIGIEVLKTIEKKQKDKFEVVGFVDNSIDKRGTFIDNIPIQLPKDIDKTKKNIKIFVAISDIQHMSEMASQMKDIGYSNIYYADKGLKQIMKVKFDSNNQAYPFFDYLETHITNGCNLKCKGCSHFSNLYETNDIVNIEVFKKDLTRISEICQIRKLRLLGGEPLLNRRLPEYLEHARKCFPETDIRLVTNGLLLPTCNKSWFKSMIKNDICIDISWYKPTQEKREKIINILETYGVQYFCFLEEINEFSKCLTLKADNDPFESQKYCQQVTCCILKEGKIYKCPFAAYMPKFNEYFNQSIENDQCIDIYGDLLELKEFSLSHVYKPIELCKYCSNIVEYFEWENNKEPKMEDWLVQGEK